MYLNSDTMKTINERISEIKAFYIGEGRGSGKVFSDSLGLTLANGRNICTPGYSVGLKYVEKILNAYKYVDANWLLTGEGSMLKREAQPTTSLPLPETERLLPDDREELETKNETIKRLEDQIEFFEDQIEFLKEVIRTKEDRIVDKDFTINELTKKLKKYEEDATNQSEITKQEKSA